MRILVTGHLGYIGSVMVPLLVEAGHDVAGMDSDFYERCTYGDDVFADVPNNRKDIRDATAEDFAGFDAVAHLAGLSNDPLGDLNPQLTGDINTEGTVHVGAMAKEAGVKRFVFSSSCSNYGAAGEDIVDETADLKPVTPYGESKVNAEVGLTGIADDAFTPVYLRSATAYGVSPRLRFDLVLNNLTAWAFTTGMVRLKSDGSAWRPIVHIRDICSAFMAALTAPRELVHCQVFNVAKPGENYRIRDLAEIVHDTVPDSSVEYAEGAFADTRCYRVSADKIVNTLKDYNPTWTAAAGAKELYDSYCKQGVKLEDFEGLRYRRVDHIKHLIAEGVLGNDLRRK